MSAPNLDKGFKECVDGVQFENPMLTQAASSEHSFGFNSIFFLPKYNYAMAELST